MTTQADSAHPALGMPPDEVETLAPDRASLFDSHTHEMLPVPPAEIQRWDILKWEGVFRTVSSVIVRDPGDVTVYFRDTPGVLPQPGDIPEGVLAITVWRPKQRPLLHV